MVVQDPDGFNRSQVHLQYGITGTTCTLQGQIQSRMPIVLGIRKVQEMATDNHTHWLGSGEMASHTRITHTRITHTPGLTIDKQVLAPQLTQEGLLRPLK